MIPRERPRSLAPFLVFGFALLLGVAVYAYAHKDVGDVEAAKAQGAALVAALEAYRAEHGEYPASLEALTPDPLPRIDPPAWGLGWNYERRSDPPGFQLVVPANASRFPLLYYDPVTRGWVLNQ